jgi:predicted nucleic acid-binding protein
MMLVDSNIWLALALSKHEFHEVARSWLTDRIPPEIALFLPGDAAIVIAAADDSGRVSPLWNSTP